MKGMKILTLILIVVLSGCDTKKDAQKQLKQEIGGSTANNEQLKPIKEGLPIIGLLVYEGVLTTEVTAVLDVFAKPTESGEQLFNVITIAESDKPLVSEEGLKIIPDYTFENCPKLKVLMVPSAYDMHAQVNNSKIVNFIKERNNETEYTVSNCAGAHLIGASGIADGKKIVTWVGGGKELQKNYPNLLVQDDSLISYVEDGKFISSNGNLATYISSLELLEKLTSEKHRAFVESYLYIDRLRDWE
ncbi:DJ-1/PfpI family protein [Fulvivirga sp. 29W222]|uniref:DJ-1/PfpI family protein n=1 Tax=Fulvivirga marina TaxID=2494733 RepID=A0A937FZT1_9BACT|nr:DJ-1/PfpI family protein [Fulvivirga marina]MBL6447958.1 DJ-1/PfpI family protein [Fulvivirga marina]